MRGCWGWRVEAFTTWVTTWVLRRDTVAAGGFCEIGERKGPVRCTAVGLGWFPTGRVAVRLVPLPCGRSVPCHLWAAGSCGAVRSGQLHLPTFGSRSGAGELFLAGLCRWFFLWRREVPWQSSILGEWERLVSGISLRNSELCNGKSKSLVAVSDTTRRSCNIYQH